MGTFAGYYGDRSVPSELREEFSTRVLTILREGGMMRIEPINLYDKSIYLLSPLKANEKGDILFSYNYFGNSFWETAGFNTNEVAFFSNKIGWGTFHNVVCAVYVLYEFYCTTFGIAEVNGRIFDAREIIRWFNHLFGEKYTNQRASDLWRIYRLLHDYDWVPEQEIAVDLIPQNPNGTISQTGLENYLVVEFFEHFKQEAQENSSNQGSSEEGKISITDRVTKLYRTLMTYRQTGRETEEEKIAWLQSLLPQKATDITAQIVKENLDDIHNKLRFWLAMNTPVVSLRIIADVFEFDFWDRLKELEGTFPNTHEMFPTPDNCPILPPLSTGDFLRRSGDERAYFWTLGGNITFSQDMTGLLGHFRQRLDIIQSQEGPLLPQGSLIRTLVEVLSDAYQVYDGIYAFQSMFCDFLEHPDDRHSQAATLLLRELGEQHKDDPKLGQKIIRRYLAVLGNKALRKQVFDF